MKSISRRHFVKGSALAAGALAWPARSWAQVLGANSDIRIAIVGFNGRGKDHIEGFRKASGARVVALCDVDQKVLEREAKKFRDRDEKIETYTDVRKLLDNKNIDAIAIATPNHWHSLIAIWACQAGKDVYVEKPVSHNVWEGGQLVRAARKYQRIVQTGTQCRSSEGLIEAINWLREGHLGKIKVSRGLCYKPRGSIGDVTGPQQPPASVDYDLWCGPAPKDPLMRERLHYDWHWVWSTGNGDLGNQGIHQMDIARWALGEKALSPRVFSVGGRLGYKDDGETPNTMFVCHDYPSAPLIFEVRGLKTPDYRGAKVGVVVDCEGGSIVIPSYQKAIAYDKQGAQIKVWDRGGNHHENFLRAVRSRNPKQLAAEILEGHLSSALCHTGNISYLLGRRSTPEALREKLQSNKAAAETFDRMSEHLAENQVDLSRSRATMGQVLEMNPEQEIFVGNDLANHFLTRRYREPFVVPDHV